MSDVVLFRVLLESKILIEKLQAEFGLLDG